MKTQNSPFASLKNTRHRLIAHCAQLALESFFPNDEARNAQLALHTNDSNASSLVSHLQELNLKLVALCNGVTCRWNGNGIDLSNGSDRVLDINPVDTYQLETDLIIFDSVSEFIDERDATNLNCKIIIETGEYLSSKAKEVLDHKGIKVIPHEFFSNIKINKPSADVAKILEQAMDTNWEKTWRIAKKNNLSFSEAFSRL